MADPKQSAVAIVRALRDHGFQAYLVGGCVRDLILKRPPADYDVATDATPDQVMRLFPKTYDVGAQFGVVLVPIEVSEVSIVSDVSDVSSSTPPKHPTPPKPSATGNWKLETGNFCVEVATFRSDVSYSDGRHPDAVRFSRDAREDVRRRDFTINGLLLDPLAGNQILDYVGGLADLHRGLIRTIGEPERRFAEDKLRMLRAARFAARFDYWIEPHTMAAIQKLAPQIAQVSRERVREELTKMLIEGRARRAFELLDETGLLREVLPEVAAMKGVAQPPQFHPEGDVWVHTLLLLEKLPHPCPRTLAWGALLHDVGKPPTFRVAPDRIRFDGHVEVGVRMAEEICRRLRFSNDDTEQIAALVANHMRFADSLKMKESTLKRFLRLPRFEEHMALHRIDCLSSHGDLTSYDFLRRKLDDTPREQIRPRPLLTGHDLLEMGYSAGPIFRIILAAVEDGQLEGRLNTRDEAVDFVRREFPRSS